MDSNDSGFCDSFRSLFCKPTLKARFIKKKELQEATEAPTQSPQQDISETEARTEMSTGRTREYVRLNDVRNTERLPVVAEEYEKA